MKKNIEEAFMAGFVRGCGHKLPDKSVAEQLFRDWLEELKQNNVRLFDFESDVLALKKTGYLIEYEIKLTVSDFRADFKKRKKQRWLINDKGITRHEYLQMGKGANRFYYVMPSDMYEKVKDEVPSWAGVITVGIGTDYSGDYTYLSIARSPKLLHKNKFGKETEAKIMTAMYWKSWNRLTQNTTTNENM